MKSSLPGILARVAAILVLVTPSPTRAEAEFCWRDSYGRGVGTIPEACTPEQDKIGLLCYSKCPAGMKRFGFDCHSVCPAGTRDDGLFCRRAEYGRGVGYPWKFGDRLNDRGMWQRCEAAQGSGNCEKNGLIVYPKCRPGYHSFGCCICRPEVPNCAALGLNPGLDLSCAKKIRIGDPRPGICGDKERDAGLCYPRCRPGYTGVGPVCWGQAPKGWVGCGMGAAKDGKTCGSAIFGQVYSVGNLALNVATFGASMLGSAASNSAGSAEELSRLRKMYEGLKAAYEKSKPVLDPLTRLYREAHAGQGTGELIADGLKDGDKVTAEDITRVSAMIAAIADPSGVASTVASYTYPKCSKYFEDAVSADAAASGPASSASAPR